MGIQSSRHVGLGPSVTAKRRPGAPEGSAPRASGNMVTRPGLVSPGAGAGATAQLGGRPSRCDQQTRVIMGIRLRPAIRVTPSSRGVSGGSLVGAWKDLSPAGHDSCLRLIITIVIFINPGKVLKISEPAQPGMALSLLSRWRRRRSESAMDSLFRRPLRGAVRHTEAQRRTRYYGQGFPTPDACCASVPNGGTHGHTHNKLVTDEPTGRKSFDESALR